MANSTLEDLLLGGSEVAPGAGMAVGATIGGLLGVAGGPLAMLTVPVASAIGGAIGGAVGGAAKVGGDVYEQGKNQADQDALTRRALAQAEEDAEKQRLLARQQTSMSLLSQFL